MEEKRENMTANPAPYSADHWPYPAGPHDAIFCDAISHDTISRDVISYDVIFCGAISRDIVSCDDISCDAILSSSLPWRHSSDPPPMDPAPAPHFPRSPMGYNRCLLPTTYASAPKPLRVLIAVQEFWQLFSTFEALKSNLKKFSRYFISRTENV